jgi:hypothetical protein
VITPAGDDYVAQSMAPLLHARPNTVGRFTDLPVFMWYEIVPVPQGRQFRYSVIFTNEDGGTATDRLMATWGRTTDVEFVYGVTLNGQRRVVAEEFQGPKHEVPAFRGRHEGAHPLLWVSTDNNMVSESGPTDIRYAPAPQRFDLANASREIVMDAHPWLYTVAAKEMVREKKLGDDPAAGSGVIPDPRRFVFVEACTDLQNAAVAFSIHAADPSGTARWSRRGRGLPEFRIVRTGCFGGGVRRRAARTTRRRPLQGLERRRNRTRPRHGSAIRRPHASIACSRSETTTRSQVVVPVDRHLHFGSTATGPSSESLIADR